MMSGTGGSVAAALEEEVVEEAAVVDFFLVRRRRHGPFCACSRSGSLDPGAGSRGQGRRDHRHVN